MTLEKLRYDGKRALVVGGASGIGEAAAALLEEAGAEVIVADVQAPKSSTVRGIAMDLRDQTAIDAALADIGGPIDTLFACAGVSGEPFSPLDVMQINFIGQRYLIESAIAHGFVGDGASITAVASIGGLGWDRNLTSLLDFLASPDMAAARKWVEEHPPADAYGLSKEAYIVYAKSRAIEFIRRGIRINVTGPGPTMTPLMTATPSWGGFRDSEFKLHTGRVGTSAEQQAFMMLFLNSDAASAINGQIIYSDLGYTAGGQVGAIDAMLVNMLAPRQS
jgi:NAD(P)-dependent dehydrogenase (short-subunit alcohol dehydrogenase family)